MVRQAKSVTSTSTNHRAVISNETGISDAFFYIKSEVTQTVNPYLSVIYTTSTNSSHVLLEQELSFLGNRYSQSLMAYKAWPQRDVLGINFQFFEALINSNTSDEMSFITFGDNEFVDQVSEFLHFLSIKSVEQKIINK